MKTKPEGATTQPTPATVPQRYMIPDEECLPKYFADEPVPSAGSKPQEEGGTLEDALIEAIAALRSSYNVQDFPADGDTRQDHAANALEAILHRRLTPSQPVADGGGSPSGVSAVLRDEGSDPKGGVHSLLSRSVSTALTPVPTLPPLFITQEDRDRAKASDCTYPEWKLLQIYACRERQLASSQEALRVARERMQQAVDVFKDIKGSTFHEAHTKERDYKYSDGIYIHTCSICKSIDSLLSPEGSSR